MALKPANETVTATNSLFEEPEMTEQAAAPEVTVAAAAAPAPAPTATAVAVAAPAQTAIAPVAKPGRFVPALTELQNAIPIDTIEGMGVGGLPRVTVDLGGFTLDGDKPLGGQLKIQLLSWNVKYALTSGSQDAEAKDTYKVSYDGINLVGGGNVEEYLHWMKTVRGYDKAAKKQYIDLWAYLIEANGKQLPEADQQVVNIQVAPFSCSKFHGFQMELGVRQARGMKVSDELYLNAERGKMGSNVFGYISFKAA